MADNRRTQIKAAIKRGTQAAQERTTALDAAAIDDLTTLYTDARRDIEAAIAAAAGAGNQVKQERLNALMRQVDQRLDSLSRARDALLMASISQGAQIGAGAFAAVAPLHAVAQAAEQAALDVRTMVAEDGLQLSDRLWRLDNQAKRVVGEAIQSAVIQGHGATQAAAELLARGQPVPDEIAAKMGVANADAIARRAGHALMTGTGNAYENALRVFRTEINRAHTTAYEQSVFEVEDTIGTRFVRSPNHKPDICDMYATENLYGLGAGVYPKGKNPYPAHPNDKCFIEAVFADEVTDADRAGQETRLDWLKAQPAATQRGVLGVHKAGALRAGVLRENQIGTPWRVLKGRYAKRGIDITDFGH